MNHRKFEAWRRASDKALDLFEVRAYLIVIVVNITNHTQTDDDRPARGELGGRLTQRVPRDGPTSFTRQSAQTTASAARRVQG
jgi:hypothetical protein